MILRAPLSVLSPRGPRGELSILIFHRVRPQSDPLFPLELTRERFDEMLSWIVGMFNVLPLPEAVERLASKSLPSRAACITFDDGYADNYLHALPVLQRHAATATFFIATGFMNGGRMWNDTLIESVRRTRFDSIDFAPLGLGTFATESPEQKARTAQALIDALKYLPPEERLDKVQAAAELCEAQLPDDLMLTDEQARGLLSAGMTIGAHTVSHPILSRCDTATARREIEDSRAELEHRLGEKVTLFAYPNGKLTRDYTPEHVALVRALGFRAAVSTNHGTSRHGDDLFQLRRFTPSARWRWQFGLRMAQNLLEGRRAPR